MCACVEGRKSAEGQCGSCRLTLLLSDRTGGEKGNRGRGEQEGEDKARKQKVHKKFMLIDPFLGVDKLKFF